MEEWAAEFAVWEQAAKAAEIDNTAAAAPAVSAVFVVPSGYMEKIRQAARFRLILHRS